MAEYSGSLLAVWYNSIDVSGQGRRVRVNENAGEPEEIDVTHKGDSEREILESYPGAQTTSVDYTCLDESDGVSTMLDDAINAVDTLWVFPEGVTHGNELLTLNNARLISRVRGLEYDGAAEIEATFHAKNSITMGTWSSS